MNKEDETGSLTVTPKTGETEVKTRKVSNADIPYD
jgi:hypothetical protein